MDFSFAFYGIWNTPAPFETIVDAIKGKVEKESSISINVSYSYQNKSTDTIAVDSLNNPFRNKRENWCLEPVDMVLWLKI
jgi:hypothetical protein